jgi:sugar lactone lactonase YvrE
LTALPGHWAFHGAHPLWSADGNRFWWADALAPSVHLYMDGQDREVATVEAPVVALLHHEDDVIAVHEQGAQRISADGQSRPFEPWLAGQVLAACNGEDGAVWAALALPEAGSAIGRLRADGTLDVQWRMGETVQALGWYAPEQTLYATAPGSGSILRLQPGQGVMRRLATVPKGSGRVSGLAFDAQGGIWTALCDGWSVVRFTADGQLDRVIGLPVPCATDLAFAPAVQGVAVASLVITTARHSVPLDTLSSAPLSGRLFVLMV